MTVQAILGLVLAIIPVVDSLIARIKDIKDATEGEYPELWAKVSADWKDAVTRWNTVIGP